MFQCDFSSCFESPAATQPSFLPLNPAFCPSLQASDCCRSIQRMCCLSKNQAWFRRHQAFEAGWCELGDVYGRLMIILMALMSPVFSGTITVSSIQVLCGPTEHYCWSHISLPLAIDASTLDLPNPVKQEFWTHNCIVEICSDLSCPRMESFFGSFLDSKR